MNDTELELFIRNRAPGNNERGYQSLAIALIALGDRIRVSGFGLTPSREYIVVGWEEQRAWNEDNRKQLLAAATAELKTASKLVAAKIEPAHNPKHWYRQFERNKWSKRR